MLPWYNVAGARFGRVLYVRLAIVIVNERENWDMVIGVCFALKADTLVDEPMV
jgi:hypothetical protein